MWLRARRLQPILAGITANAWQDLKTMQNVRKMTTILQINRQDLRAELQSIVAEIRSDERKQIEKDEDRLLDPDAVKSMASISETTLWRWQKAGYLTPIYIGGVRRYRLSEVESLMSGGC